MKQMLLVGMMVVGFIASSQWKCWALDYVATVIVQKGAPITITAYRAGYVSGNNYELAGIKHVIEYKNTGKQRVDAVEFGFVSFDAWNEFLDKMNGFSRRANDIGDSEDGEWITRPYSDFSFLSGFAYVGRIRFADGSIWVANREEIQNELTKIQTNFDMNNLNPKIEKK